VLFLTRTVSGAGFHRNNSKLVIVISARGRQDATAIVFTTDLDFARVVILAEGRFGDKEI